jgi:predicted lipoprotein with Yx(FWY)xxD motif
MKSQRIVPLPLTSLLGLLASAAMLASACIAEEPGIDPGPSAGATGGSVEQAGTSAAVAGSTDQMPGGGSGAAAGTSSTAQGGSANGGGANGGNAGSSNAGTQAIGEGGVGGASPVGEGGAAPGPESCIFHTDAPVSPAGGAGGAGPASTITMQTSPFVGSYLADGAGRTLYFYGADLPGDCRVDSAPVSRCEADCLISWPVFDAGERVLGAGLSDAGFGSIKRADGAQQTTYFGWPLYYYKSDLELGQMTGQGKGKTWHVAETTPASIVIMKAGAVKYLADGGGRTLYVSAADTVGSGNSEPISACSGACLQTFERFRQKNPSLVPSLEAQDFSVFLADSATLELAYKGQPLYRARTDLKAGDATGTATSGFTVAIP